MTITIVALNQKLAVTNDINKNLENHQQLL